MRLVSEIFKALSAEAGGGVQYTVIDGQGGYFQNVRRVLEFSDTTVVLRGRKSAVRIVGKGLSLEKYCGGDVAVKGDVARVERVES